MLAWAQGKKNEVSSSAVLEKTSEMDDFAAELADCVPGQALRYPVFVKMTMGASWSLSVA